MPQEVYSSGPFQPREGSRKMETGRISARRGYSDGNSHDLGEVTVSAFPYGAVELWSREDVSRYRDWVNRGLDAAAEAAFGPAPDPEPVRESPQGRDPWGGDAQ